MIDFNTGLEGSRGRIADVKARNEDRVIYDCWESQRGRMVCIQQNFCRKPSDFDAEYQ
jgi:hypothetical protein